MYNNIIIIATVMQILMIKQLVLDLYNYKMIKTVAENVALSIIVTPPPAMVWHKAVLRLFP